eukprot:jgi/Botrbrau1/23542/Bobra.0141s0013.1
MRKQEGEQEGGRHVLRENERSGVRTKRPNTLSKTCRCTLSKTCRCTLSKTCTCTVSVANNADERKRSPHHYVMECLQGSCVSNKSRSSLP